MRCNLRSCTHCFPPNAEAISALESVRDSLEYSTKSADDVLGWNSDEYWEFHEQPWFQAILMAYNAGIAAARKVVQEELDRLND